MPGGGPGGTPNLPRGGGGAWLKRGGGGRAENIGSPGGGPGGTKRPSFCCGLLSFFGSSSSFSSSLRLSPLVSDSRLQTPKTNEQEEDKTT